MTLNSFILQALFILNIQFVIVYSKMDPLLEICFDDTVDAVVRSETGSVLVIKSSQYWELDEPFTKVGRCKTMESQFPSVPETVAYGFTLFGTTTEWNNMTNRTIFVAGDTWYQFYQTKLERKDSTVKWLYVPSENMGRFSMFSRQTKVKTVMTTHDSSLVYFDIDFSSQVGQEAATRKITMAFHDAEWPEVFDSVQLHKQVVPFSADGVKYLVPTKGESYIIFTNTEYCWIKHLKSTCDKRGYIVDIFDCPEYVLMVKRHWIYWSLRALNLDVNGLLAVVGGTIVAINLILLQNLFFLWAKVRAFREDRRTTHKKTKSTTVGKSSRRMKIV